MRTGDIRIRDPFVLPVRTESACYLFGATDVNCWSGPGMIFQGFDGRLFLTYHMPNETPNERPFFVEIEDTGEGGEAEATVTARLKPRTA